MANGLFANSKNALFFAGGVIACAAIAALTLGSQFTPKGENDYLGNRGVTNEEAIEETTLVQSTAQPDAQAADDLSGFADDTDLLDDTSGLDTTPLADGAATLASGESGGTNGFSESAFNPTSEPALTGAKSRVFGDYKPDQASAKPSPPVRRSGPVRWEPKVNPLPPDPPPGQPFPKDRKIIELVEPPVGG